MTDDAIFTPKVTKNGLQNGLILAFFAHFEYILTWRC
jgi:hypothetical protein